MFKHVCIAILVLFLISCYKKTSINDADLMRFNKTMTKGDVFTLTTVTPDASYRVENGTVQLYKHNNNLYPSQYLLYYKHGKLDFWGYPQDFAKSNRPELNKIHQEVLKQQMNGSITE